MKMLDQDLAKGSTTPVYRGSERFMVGIGIFDQFIEISAKILANLS
ncbi:hypothetical protein [Rhizobium sp. 18055]|jgi:hypothetical protein|nr:hypothetical protein [Rhizobium sp. 18055]